MPHKCYIPHITLVDEEGGLYQYISLSEAWHVLAKPSQAMTIRNGSPYIGKCFLGIRLPFTLISFGYDFHLAYYKEPWLRRWRWAGTCSRKAYRNFVTNLQRA